MKSEISQSIGELMTLWRRSLARNSLTMKTFQLILNRKTVQGQHWLILLLSSSTISNKVRSRKVIHLWWIELLIKLFQKRMNTSKKTLLYRCKSRTKRYLSPKRTIRKATKLPKPTNTWTENPVNFQLGAPTNNLWTLVLMSYYLSNHWKKRKRVLWNLVQWVADNSTILWIARLSKGFKLMIVGKVTIS